MHSPHARLRLHRRPLRVFCSSTYLNFLDYLSAVENVLTNFESRFVGMEHFGARTTNSLETCLLQIDQSDLVVCLVGTLYGSKHEGVSYTELEIRRAHSRGIPILAFLLNAKRQPVLAHHVSSGEDAEKLDAFVDWLRINYTTAAFTTPESLTQVLAASLFKYLQGERMNDAFEEINNRLSRTRQSSVDVFGVSAHNLDFIHLVDLVAPDHETTIAEAKPFPGGSGANTLCALGRLGIRSYLTGIVVDDEAGRELMDNLRSFHVNCDHVCVEAGDLGFSTGRTRIYTDEHGQRIIFVDPGVNENWSEHLTRRPGMKERIIEAARASRVLHCSSFTGGREIEFTEELIASVPPATVVSLAPGSIYAKRGLDRLSALLTRTNLLFLYEVQLDTLLSRRPSFNPKRMTLRTKLDLLFEWRASMGCREPLLVAVKKSSRTSVSAPVLPSDFEVAYGIDRLQVMVPPATVPGDWHSSGTDTTGTKDALAAGIILGLLSALDFNECVDVGYAMALLASRKIGARSALPDFSELSYFCGIKMEA